MYHRQTIAIVGAIHALLFSSIATITSANVVSRSSDGATGVLRLSDLRSAYLVRVGAVHYDPRSSSVDENRRQLERHFDVVLALLLKSTDRSIGTALERLEHASGQRWSDTTRNGWRQRLLTARMSHLLRLKAYRDRGQFPLNERYADGPTPIFVDEHNTACAVGHLMRLDNWKLEVAAIRADENLVYVTDIATGPVVRWVLTSGLTVEEAAVIQPAYNFFPTDPPPIPPDAIKPTISNWSGIIGDLRYSNFKLIENTGVEASPSTNIPVTHRFCGLMWCSIASSAELFPAPVAELQTDPQLSAASVSLADQSWIGDMSRVVVQFDVETVSPKQRLVQLPYAMSLLTWPDEELVLQRNELALFVDGNMQDVYIHDAPDPEPAREIADGFGNVLGIVQGGDGFEPTRKMTVVTELLFGSGHSHQAQFVHFDVITVVPEPGSLSLFAFAFALLAVNSRRRAKRRASSLSRANTARRCRR